MSGSVFSAFVGSFGRVGDGPLGTAAFDGNYSVFGACDPFSLGAAAFGGPTSDFMGVFSSDSFLASRFCSPRAGSLSFCDLAADGAFWDFGVEVDFSASEANGVPDGFGVAVDDGAAPVADFGAGVASGWAFC